MKLLFLGDSLIEYYDWQSRFPEHTVINSGMAGESVEGLLGRVMRIKEVCPEADHLFIMSGINNVAMGDLEFLECYRVIIERLSEAYRSAMIHAVSLLPVIVDFIDNESIRKINGLLRDIALKTDAEYMDLYRRFVDSQGRPIKEYLLDDGVHLSGHGYACWSGAVEEAIKLSHA